MGSSTSNVMTQFIQRQLAKSDAFLSKMFAQPGDTPHPRISVSLICKFLYLRLTMFSSEIKSVHFVGIGGTAMASAAAAMKEKGFAVTGSDQNVYRVEEEIDFATDQEIEELKMRRAKLKDYIYHLIRHAPAACPAADGTGGAP